MQKTAVKYPSTFRFKKWSRKAYAVFSSLGREVTIGFIGGVSLGFIDQFDSAALNFFDGLAELIKVKLNELKSVVRIESTDVDFASINILLN